MEERNIYKIEILISQQDTSTTMNYDVLKKAITEKLNSDGSLKVLSFDIKEV